VFLHRPSNHVRSSAYTGGFSNIIKIRLDQQLNTQEKTSSSPPYRKTSSVLTLHFLSSPMKSRKSTMSSKETHQTQALVGLSVMSFATLAFHGLWRALYPDECVARPLQSASPIPPRHQSTFENSQFQAIMSRLDLLSSTIAQVNSSLHLTINSELQALNRAGSWTQRQQYVFTQKENVAIASIFLILPWFIGMLVFYDALSKVSKAMAKKALLYAFISANIGLMYAIMFAGPAYVYVLCVFWPILGTLAAFVCCVDVEVVDVGAKKGEKE
jgi:hypothetical protein